MTEPTRAPRDALAQVAHHWDTERTERTLHGARAKQSRQRRQRALLWSVATLCLLAGVGSTSRHVFREARQEQVTSRASPARVPSFSRDTVFEDGSHISLLDANARVVVEEVSRTRVSVRLAGGHVRVEVTPRPERRFRVLSGDVEVEVLGTAFELQRAAQRTRVAVLHGRVAVRWPGGQSELSAGEAGWFPKPSVQPDTKIPALDGASQPRAHKEHSRPSPLARANPLPVESSLARRTARFDPWRVRAEQGDFNRAYELMARAPERVGEDVKDLLLAADAARLSGHAAQALPFLRRVIEQHPEDPRAPLAAFTLGGVLMNQLGQPGEAEAAYGRARTLAISPSLAQDALARQVEAAQRASDPARARALATQYLELYPDGRRVRAVRRLGGL